MFWYTYLENIIERLFQSDDAVSISLASNFEVFRPVSAAHCSPNILIISFILKSKIHSTSFLNILYFNCSDLCANLKYNRQELRVVHFAEYLLQILTVKFDI